jgi:branched-chain amino acid transport system ATP-binding protein
VGEAVASGNVLLDARELTVRFGGVRAVDALSLQVPAAGLVGLIGPNGAGKTTTIDALSGFVPHDGRVLLDGADLTHLPAHARASAGFARTFQSLELFDDLTVLENCLVAAEQPGFLATAADAVRPGRRVDVDAVWWALGVVGLEAEAGRYPLELPLGLRKLVAVARALAGQPKLVLLDEPAAGLDSGESLVLGQRLRDVVGHGIGVLLVDHDMGLVLGTCDRVYVLDFGRVIASGTPLEIRNDPSVIDAYLGQTHGPGPTRPVGRSPGPVAVPGDGAGGRTP